MFVITDGEVSNSSECINLVNRNARNNRVFTLGIGSSADRHLVKVGTVGVETSKCYLFIIKGMARVGLGTAVFTGYNENIAGKVIKQLKVRTDQSELSIGIDNY